MIRLSYMSFSIDIILCQSVYRRQVAKKKQQWLCDITHEEACASHIKEIWRAFVQRERFVRVVSKTEIPRHSAIEIDKVWIEYAAQSKYRSIFEGEQD